MGMTQRLAGWRLGWAGLSGPWFDRWTRREQVSSGGLWRDPANGLMCRLPPISTPLSGPGIRLGPLELSRPPPPAAPPGQASQGQASKGHDASLAEAALPPVLSEAEYAAACARAAAGRLGCG